MTTLATALAAEPRTIRAGAYQRISFDKAGDGHGVANQLADQVRTAEARGQEIVLTESDNDISALTGKHRPGYERIMAAAARGEIDVILVYQTSRFWRNRRERAEGIEILRRAGVSLIATKGPSLDMSSAYGRMMCGLLGEFDTAESEIKSERQQLANREAAMAGKARKATPRPFGWRPDRIARDPAEAAAVADACRALLAGGTLAGIAREWDRRGLRPHQAPFGPLPRRAWKSVSVTEILRNPRVAGISMYKGAEVGRGEWETIVPEETWRAVVRLLADPSRGSTAGVRTMLGGVALCRCGNHISASVSQRGEPVYRCNRETQRGRPGPHVAARRADVDEAIGGLVVARLSMADAADLMAPAAKADTAALRDEAMGIRDRLGRLGSLFALGQIEEADMIGGRQKGNVRLAEIEAGLADLGRESVLAPLVGAKNVKAAWEVLGDDRRRAVVDALMVVTLNPAGRGARVFDALKVISIEWKEV